MGTVDDIDFEPEGFEDGSAQRIEPCMSEDVVGKAAAALTFSGKVVLTSGSDPGAM